MNVKEAREAIEAILVSIPDNELPEFDKIEDDPDYGPVAWWGSHGYHIASSRDGNGEPNPLSYRASGAWHAIEQEMVARASKRYFDNGGELRTSSRRSRAV